jgi:hypothetical protein
MWGIDHFEPIFPLMLLWFFVISHPRRSRDNSKFSSPSFSRCDLVHKTSKAAVLRCSGERQGETFGNNPQTDRTKGAFHD